MDVKIMWDSLGIWRDKFVENKVQLLLFSFLWSW
jgi:hypothetical protein